MYCQLDQVGSIFDMTAVVQKTLQKELPSGTDITDLSFNASAIMYGLLLLNDHDVFLKKGRLVTDLGTSAHYWVELFMDGELFILTYVPGEIIFMLEEEALAQYEFSGDSDVHWQEVTCEPGLWQSVLQAMGVNQPVQQVLETIAENCA